MSKFSSYSQRLSAALAVLIAAVLTAGVTLAETGGHSVQIQENFSCDPRWPVYGLRHPPSAWPTRRQDFGWSPDAMPGAATVGMIGGWIERSTTPATYSLPIQERTLNDRLQASGLFRVLQAGGSSGSLFGWFNEDSRGWRTPNSLVLRVDGNGSKFWVFFEYGTQHRLTGGMDCFEGEAYQTTTTQPFPADGSVHRWSLDYDPTGASGDGLITFTLDG